MIDDSSADLTRSSGFGYGPLVPLFPGFTVSGISLLLGLGDCDRGIQTLVHGFTLPSQPGMSVDSFHHRCILC